MQSNRFFFRPKNYPYHYNQFPPHTQMNHQPYPPYQTMPFHQGAWQPPYQDMQGMGPEQKSPIKGVMGYFQNDQGKFDVDKVLNTAGQVANTYQQFSPIVKGIGSFFKGG
ncbi:YppG family protein [Amphibacillus indicireducens]|uniref:YppG-like protein n=1 Tax=Amphibacillus indicireducens TaxID=1076330 RepID=A0ABP7VUS9_9BACI